MVRILCADIAGADEAVYRSLYGKATPERQRRAEGFRRREDALRCLAADALLRHALGTDRYTVVQEKGGKPKISGHPNFHYNLSHAGRWVVLAWGDGEVGVDVEAIRQDARTDALASRYFTPDEQAYLRAGDPISCFFQLWTRKESYLKFLGTGLSKSLSGFSVLSGETGVGFRQWELPGGYWLCLCSREKEIFMEMAEISRLTLLRLTEQEKKPIM